MLRNNNISNARLRVAGVAARFFVASCCYVAVLGACATPPTGDPEALAEWEATNDPLEPLNRGIFNVNLALDHVLFRPLAIGYRWVFPNFMCGAIRNVLENLGEPVNFANSILQGQLGRAGTSAGRLVVNSTVGVGGLIDVAEAIGRR